MVTNSVSSVTSNPATLTVNTGTATAPVFTLQPVSATVTAPATATFTVAASGNPAPTYQWMRKNPGGGSFAAISGATSASYTTVATSPADSGTQFECVATNTSGSATSNAATLTVQSIPVILSQPSSVTVTAPATATFFVFATGNPAPSYQWMQEASGGSSFTAISGATNSSYTTPATTAANSGTQYECVVSNSAGSVTSSPATLTVNPALPSAPMFTLQPVSTTVTVPAAATFTVAATGTPTPTYQWMQEAPGGSSFTAISGATSASYTTPATTAANSGTQYECVATNSSGSTTSIVATLTVQYGPAITSQPSSATVTAPATASFTVAATGNPAPTYQWMQEAPGGSSFTAISGATSFSYTTPATSVANSGTQYECVVTNSVSSVTSNPATLTVNAAPAAPVFTLQPANTTVTVPATATLTVAASGNPTPTYQWMQEAPGGSSFTAISGATSASYTTVATTAANDGTKYECVAANSSGSVTSNAATLTVQYGPAITSQPSSATVTAPATATFTVAATGNPAPTYQWMQEAPGASSFTAISGATNASYTTPATTVANSQTHYECVVTNSVNSVTSSPATLTVNPAGPVFTLQPVSATVTAPATATFTAAATGTPAPTYQWMQEAPGASSFTAVSGATSASYTTPATTSANDGTKYECVATNSSGSTTSNVATLTVQYGPAITSQPSSATVTAPATATFTVAATGNPAPTYQWMQEALGASSFTPVSGATSASYTTPPTTVLNNGTQYECVVTSSVGSVTSNPATLMVNGSLPADTSVTLFDTTTPVNPLVGSAGAVSLGVQFQSSQAGTITGVRFYKLSGDTGTHIGYLWTASGTLLASATFTGETSTGWQQVSFAAPVTIGANTTYVASYYAPAGGYPANFNYFNSAVTHGPLTALASASVPHGNGVYVYGGPGSFPTATYNGGNYWVDVVYQFSNPDIVTQPASVSVTAGATATFSVTAAGTPAPTYQWQQEAAGAGSYTAVSGATSASYTTPATTTANSGTQYRCLVTNSAGSVTSDPATLIVNSTSSVSLFGTTTPAASVVGGGGAVNLGVQFQSSQAGTITGVRFYKLSGDTGTHIGYLWTASGTLLASATFTGETSTGWQQVTFAAPVTISANTTYVASYYAPAAGFPATFNYFNSAATHGPLTALASPSVPHGNGVYAYAGPGSFPTANYTMSNYWVDVVFEPST